uniref:Uncharacterized protein n=1 Tax=Anguilla anguilla TaxID=7936 RepID=A0A0E9X128_ANGAN
MHANNTTQTCVLHTNYSQTDIKRDIFCSSCNLKWQGINNKRTAVLIHQGEQVFHKRATNFL